MTNPINNSNTQSFLLTPLKIIKSIGWVALAILALPSSLVGYRHSRLFLGKAVAVWNKNHDPTVNKTDNLAQSNARNASYNKGSTANSLPPLLNKEGVQKKEPSVSVSSSSRPQAISKKVSLKPLESIENYMWNEWGEKQENAEIRRNGYQKVINDGYKHIIVVRGDNYCALRASLFQMLRQGVPFPSKEKTLNCLIEEIKTQPENHWLFKWNFSNIERTGESINGLTTMSQCMEAILITFEEGTKPFLEIESEEERQKKAYELMNCEQGDEIFMEALKLHMMARTLNLYKDPASIPEELAMTFNYTYETAKDLFNYSINTIGVTGGTDQIGMHLLSHTLGHPIPCARLLEPFRVKRKKDDGVEEEVDKLTEADFSTVFGTSRFSKNLEPNQNYIITEDNRHYNVLI